jgi:hypothetical protein
MELWSLKFLAFPRRKYTLPLYKGNSVNAIRQIIAPYCEKSYETHGHTMQTKFFDVRQVIPIVTKVFQMVNRPDLVTLLSEYKSLTPLICNCFQFVISFSLLLSFFLSFFLLGSRYSFSFLFKIRLHSILWAFLTKRLCFSQLYKTIGKYVYQTTLF